MEKVFFKGLDLLKPNVHFPSKMPRTAAIPVVRDPETGDLNAGVYSSGVANLKPLHILFGPKVQPLSRFSTRLKNLPLLYPPETRSTACGS